MVIYILDQIFRYLDKYIYVDTTSILISGLNMVVPDDRCRNKTTLRRANFLDICIQQDTQIDQ